MRWYSWLTAGRPPSSACRKMRSAKHSTPVMPCLGLLVRHWRSSECSSSASTAGTARLAYINRTSIVALLGSDVALLGQQRQKLAAQMVVLQEGAAHHAVGHRRVVILDATPMHTEMIGFHH